MRSTLVGAFVVAVLVIVASAGTGSTETGFSSPVNHASTAQAAELITHMTAAEGQPQVVTVIDPRTRVLAVYHVDRATGQITPKSVRNITWDLQMIEFNSGDPLPQDIRSGLQH